MLWEVEGRLVTESEMRAWAASASSPHFENSFSLSIGSLYIYLYFSVYNPFLIIKENDSYSYLNLAFFVLTQNSNQPAFG